MTWEGEEEFILEDLGPGECAGGALEMIENGILEADQELYQAKLLVEKHQYSVSVNKSYRAVLAAAKALLVTEGLEPSTDPETFSEFDSELRSKVSSLPSTETSVRRWAIWDRKKRRRNHHREKMVFAKGFVDACRTATDQMGKDLKLSAVQDEPPPPVPTPVEIKPAAPVPTGAPVYDLRGVACPMNYVKTKLKLEMMDAGERLEVWLDAGEPIKNVPMSVKNDGHKVLIQEALEPEASHYRILVEKVEG